MNHAVRRQQVFLVLILGLLLGLASSGECVNKLPADSETEDYRLLKEIILTEFSGEIPHEWGNAIPGVRTQLKTEEKTIAIALDVCDMTAKGEDQKLIRFFDAESVPVTLSVCGEWIDKNRAVLKQLAVNSLFEIANSGLVHRPCSVTGKSAAGMRGTRNIEDVFTEIEKNARKIEAVTGLLPIYYRSGAGFYDEVAVRIAKALGYEVIGSKLFLSQEGPLNKQQLLEIFQTAPAGAIAVLEAGFFKSATSDDLIDTIRKLKVKGFKFVKLSDYPFK